MNKYALTAFLMVAASAPAVHASECRLTIAATDQMQFDRRELLVPSTCTEVEVSLVHAGKSASMAMAHDWVLARTNDVPALAQAGMAAGAAHDYQPANDPRIIAATKLVQGGGTTSVRFSLAALKSGADYTFFCSSPGHASMMKGKFIYGGKADSLAARNN
jgi:azurin